MTTAGLLFVAGLIVGRLLGDAMERRYWYRFAIRTNTLFTAPVANTQMPTVTATSGFWTEVDF